MFLLLHFFFECTCWFEADDEFWRDKHPLQSRWISYHSFLLLFYFKSAYVLNGYYVLIFKFI